MINGFRLFCLFSREGNAISVKLTVGERYKGVDDVIKALPALSLGPGKSNDQQVSSFTYLTNIIVMGKNVNSFNDYIVRNVIAKNEFGINEVKEIEDVRTMILDRHQYPSIVELIKQVNFGAVRDLPETAGKTSEAFREYLSVVKFTDQNKKEYCVTVYDSDELWQDPEVMDIFPL